MRCASQLCCEPRDFKTTHLALSKHIAMMIPCVHKAPPQAPADAAKVAQRGGGDVGAAGKVSRAVEQRRGAVQRVRDVVDGTALTLLSVRGTQVLPVISCHATARWSQVAVASSLKRD